MYTIDRKAVLLLKQSRPDLHEKLSKFALEHDVSVTSLVAEAVARFALDMDAERHEALRDIDKRIKRAKEKCIANMVEALPGLKTEDLKDEMLDWPALFE